MESRVGLGESLYMNCLPSLQKIHGEDEAPLTGASLDGCKRVEPGT